MHNLPIVRDLWSAELRHSGRRSCTEGVNRPEADASSDKVGDGRTPQNNGHHLQDFLRSPTEEGSEFYSLRDRRQHQGRKPSATKLIRSADDETRIGSHLKTRSLSLERP